MHLLCMSSKMTLTEANRQSYRKFRNTIIFVIDILSTIPMIPVDDCLMGYPSIPHRMRRLRRLTQSFLLHSAILTTGEA